MDNPKSTTRENCGCSTPAGCGGRLDRRDFLKFMGATTAGALLARSTPVMAGPFTDADFDKMIPADKKLNPEWVKSLFARGARAVYRGAELGKIGMPVGGLCAGQLYLGGDGRLWHWDIFNKGIGTGDKHYSAPPDPDFPLAQGFALKIQPRGSATAQTRTLDRRGFPGVTFCGEYPIGFVDYADPACPVKVALEAFSPFVPLAADDSSLPATVLRFTLKNVSQEPVEAELGGWLQNAVCLYTGAEPASGGTRHNRIRREAGLTLLECLAEPPAPLSQAQTRPPVVFADFEGLDYGAWKAEGQAFGARPASSVSRGDQFLSGARGKGLVNTWNGSDAARGKLISPEFKIERPFINFLIGGGNHPGQTCLNLIVGSKTMHTATGKNSDALEWASWNVAALAGQTAHFEIIDAASGAWGHIDIDQIELADAPRNAVPFHQRHDYGTMALALLEGQPGDTALAALGGLPGVAPEEEVFSTTAWHEASSPLGQPLLGGLWRRVNLDPGAEATVSFAVTWHFPNWIHSRLQDVGGRYYAVRFTDAAAVARHLAENYAALYAQTRRWHDTWYDSTLPRWFLDRTFLNTSILATSTCYRVASGRFWAWEGVGCCEGTCTHVWHYAQAMGRLFPELERDTRERVDYGVSFDPDTGVIGFRGEYDRGLAVDGQAGTILRTYREHLMSPDDAFLRRNWLRIRKAFEPLLALDADRDGIMTGAQMNTLDRPWFGEVAWLSSLYLAALRAGEAMARIMDDPEFAETCATVAARGAKSIDERLFNGEYYQHTADPANAKSVGSFNGCEIDQVFGQSWAWQVGLGRILPEGHVRQALAALWKYNFTLDVGPFRAAHRPGRWYAMAGEGGLIMCTWPRGEQQRNAGNFDAYFNECMNGFEYQAAGHMIWEGMVQEGLAVTRALHDRYHPLRRNPWNEVECGDHYARSMASYGVFLAACGFEYNGPAGRLGFAPRLAPEDFRAAFTAAEGWGTLSQKREGGAWRAAVEVQWGKLKVKTLALGALPGVLEKAGGPGAVRVTLAGQPVAATATMKDGRLEITLASEAVIGNNQKLEVVIG